MIKQFRIGCGQEILLNYPNFGNKRKPLGLNLYINRWGRNVAELNNFAEPWNGKINGSPAAEGVYFWVCDYSALNKYGNLVKHKQQGSVTLLR